MESPDYYLSILKRINSADVQVSDWEAGFIDSILKRNQISYSLKQVAVIERMKDKYLSEAQVTQLQMFDDPDGDDIPY